MTKLPGNTYETLYTVRDHDWFSPVSSPFVLALLVLVLPIFLRKLHGRIPPAVVALAVTLAVGLLALGTFLLFRAKRQNEHLCDRLQSENYAQVEGIVTDFVAANSGQKTLEKFSVNGVQFRVDPANHSRGGLTQTYAGGGPIRVRDHVRIAYVESRGARTIIRVERAVEDR